MPLSASRTQRLHEWFFLFCATVFTGGVYLDGWAHNHIPLLESFFTPWHAVLYSGYGFTALSLILWTAHQKRRGLSWKDAIPAGHGLSLAGAAVFAVGGVADMLWHIAFGIEADVEALLSPTHLVLAVGMTMMVSGGMRHYRRTRDAGRQGDLASMLPMVLSFALTWAVLLFMTQFAHYTDFEATGHVGPAVASLRAYQQELPILGIILFSISLVGCLSLPLRRERLPLGSITVALTSIVAALSMMRSGTALIPAAFVSGIVADVLLQVIEQSPYRVRLLRGFCFVLPALYYLLVFVTLMRTKGIWWSIHMWAGSIVIAGLAGLLVGLVAWPPSTKTLDEME